MSLDLRQASNPFETLGKPGRDAIRQIRRDVVEGSALSYYKK